MASTVATKRLLSGSVDGQPITIRPVLTAALTVPTAPSTALSGGAGTMTDGAHTAAITFYTEFGETTIGAAGTARTTVVGSNGNINLTAIPCDPSGLAIGRKVYVSKAATATPFYYVATIADNTTTTYTIEAPDTSLSWLSPAANTAYSSKLTAPTAPTTVLAAGGGCTDGAHSVAISYVTANGETAPGVLGTARTTGAGNSKILCTAIPVDATGQATGRNVYMSKTGTTWPLFLVAASPVIADNITQTYTIDVADGAVGAASGANTAVPTLIHTAVAGSTAGTYDEVWLWAQNSHTADVVLTLEFGTLATTALLPQYYPIQKKTMTIPFQKGLFLVLPGFVLQGGNVIRASASVANVITLTGFVNAMVDA